MRGGEPKPWQGWRRALVVGLGKTGFSCARFLTRLGIEVAITDTRAAPPQLAETQEHLPDVALFLGGFDPAAFEAADGIVVSPGVSLREPLIEKALTRGVPVIGDVDLFAAVAEASVVAITGSNGKSTVTTLVGAMAREAGLNTAVGGNLGTPLLDLVAPEIELYVVELSSFQLERAHRLDAAAAAVLNVSEDHMDRYRDLEEYCAAKARIFGGSGVMVLNAEDFRVAAMAREGRRTIWFGLSERESGYGLEEATGGAWLTRDGERLIAAADLTLSGRHNLANALAALALAEAVDLPLESALKALRGFRGLAHRCEWIAERGDVAWINDSKATNVGATVAALEGFDRPVILIAGGDSKGADLTPLVAPVGRHARVVILLGRDADRLQVLLEPVVPVQRVASMEEAVEAAARAAMPGDVVLLSPACASLDMFADYRERGERFATAVRRLGS
ncbi:MAG: UDP-N-acetylmuramoyl-L-alanine--D-glutamate ligase [Gammaproteobacteria bacterium]